MDSKQQEQQVDRQFREEGEEEWEDEGGEEKELVTHTREPDFGTHCLSCQSKLVAFIHQIFVSGSSINWISHFFSFSSWDLRRLISQRGLRLWRRGSESSSLLNKSRKQRALKHPRWHSFLGTKYRSYGSQQGCLISGGADCFCRRCGHTGVKVQEDLTPVPSAQVPQLRPTQVDLNPLTYGRDPITV